jgi:hypothetical protein
MHLNDTALSPQLEVFGPTGNLNTLIKQSAEKLLPLLGEQIRLRSFCASGLFPIVISPTQIDDILCRVFIQAREEMNTGGIVLLHTEHSTIRPDIVLTVRYAGCGKDSILGQETSFTIHLC